MVYRRGHKKTKQVLAFDPFHMGATDCLRYRELRCPFITPSLDQLRYLLGWITFAKNETEECSLPEQIDWKHRRGNKVNGKYKPGPWDKKTS